MLKHLKKGFSGDYGISMNLGTLRTLCTLEWPSFQVGRPWEGTLDVPQSAESGRLLLETLVTQISFLK